MYIYISPGEGADEGSTTIESISINTTGIYRSSE